MEIKYILVPESQLNISKEAKKAALTKLDWENLVENEWLIKKWLLKNKFSYRLSLSEWKAKGKEETIYVAMETINELIKALESVWHAMETYNAEQERLEEEKKLQNKK